MTNNFKRSKSEYCDSKVFHVIDGKFHVIDGNVPFEETITKNKNGPAKIKYIPNYLNDAEADQLLKKLCDNIKWKQRESLTNKGKPYKEPRMTYWYGKPYNYSGVSWSENEEWNEDLKNLKDQLNRDHPIHFEKSYNSVMCNRYRNNKDSIGWHADNEKSLGRNPKIASISLGSTRIFEVCKKKEYYAHNINNRHYDPDYGMCTIVFQFHLKHGSLLIMEGSVQDDWLHRVPKESEKMEDRINLTFRHIIDEEDYHVDIESQKKKYVRTEIGISDIKLKKEEEKEEEIEEEYQKDYCKFQRNYPSKS